MSDENITESTFPKQFTPSPLLQGMPAHLKDPKNYKKIKKAIYDAFAGSCTSGHGEIMDWAACPTCQRRFHERIEVMHKLGFSSPQQYLMWDKIHTVIKERVPLPKYDD